jgi:hypothetical protein
LRADEKHIRTQSAILYNPPTLFFGVNHNRVFCADALFIRTENTVGARERASPRLTSDGISDAVCNSTDPGHQHLNIAAAASM